MKKKQTQAHKFNSSVLKANRGIQIINNTNIEYCEECPKIAGTCDCKIVTSFKGRKQRL